MEELKEGKVVDFTNKRKEAHEVDIKPLEEKIEEFREEWVEIMLGEYNEDAKKNARSELKARYRDEFETLFKKALKTSDRENLLYELRVIYADVTKFEGYSYLFKDFIRDMKEIFGDYSPEHPQIVSKN